MDARYPTLIIWLVVLLLGGWWTISHVSLRTDLSLFLPQTGAEQQRLLLDELNQGPASRLLLLGIQGGDLERRIHISQQLAARLRQTPHFERVENGAPSELKIDQTLFQYRYLLAAEHQIADFSPEKLNKALKQRLEELNSPFPSPFKPLLTADPTGVFQTSLRKNLYRDEIPTQQGVWNSRQGDTALLLAQTQAGGLALDQQEAAVSAIRTHFEQLDTLQEHRLIVSGPGAFGVISRNIIHQESQNLSIIASATIAFLLWLGYHYLPYLLFAALPLLTALLSASIVSSLIFNELHGITLAFGITLLGVTIDYPLHLFSHLPNNEQARKSMQEIWHTLSLGVITTCIGYVVLVTTDFTGLRQLGVFTLSGLISAALVSRYLLPRLFPVPFHAPKPKGINILLPLLTNTQWPSVIVVLIALLSLLFLVFSTKPFWQDDIANLSPLPQTLLQQDRFLRAELGSSEPNHLLLMQAATPEALLQTSEAVRARLRKFPEQALGDIALPSDYLPSMQTQMARQQQLPDSQWLRNSLEQAVQNTPFRFEAFAPFLADINNSRSLPLLSYDSALKTDLKPLLESLVRHSNRNWLALIPLHNTGDPARLAHYVKTQLPEVEYRNLRDETSQLIGEFREHILQRITLGGVFMLLLLWYGLRSLRWALVTLFPIGLAIMSTMAAIHLIEEALNLFHVISLILVLGISLDYSLFFGRQEPREEERLSTLHALSICALSTMGVFAILASSSIPVLHAIGITVAIGVGISFLSTYALSCAMKSSHYRRTGERSTDSRSVS
jgi:predicted exporter